MPSLYLCVFGLIIALTICGFLKKEWDKTCYHIGIIVMSIFLCIRFGQGTDYPSYWNIYEYAELALEPTMGFFEYWRTTREEIGWQLLMVLFKTLRMDFRAVVGILSVIMMFCTHKAITRYCKTHKTVALVLLYPTIYLTYYFSGLRQGLIMAVFLGVLLGLLLDKKIVQYFLGVILLMTIHKSSFIYLLVPFALCFKKRMYIIGTILSVVFSICMCLEPFRNLIIYISSYFGRAASYLGNVSVSLTSLMERIVMLSIVIFLYWRRKKHDIENDYAVDAVMKVYYMGFLIYICLCTNSLVSSRLAIMFKISEFILIPMLLECSDEVISKCCILLLCAISTVMTCKNINSYISQSAYHKEITVWNYPYVSIFNCEDILEYREGFIDNVYGFNEENNIKSGKY